MNDKSKTTDQHDLVAVAEDDLNKIESIARQIGGASLGKMDSGTALSLINVRTQAVQALALARLQRDYRPSGLDLRSLSNKLDS